MLCLCLVNTERAILVDVGVGRLLFAVMRRMTKLEWSSWLECWLAGYNSAYIVLSAGQEVSAGEGGLMASRSGRAYARTPKCYSY